MCFVGTQQGTQSRHNPFLSLNKCFFVTNPNHITSTPLSQHKIENLSISILRAKNYSITFMSDMKDKKYCSGVQAGKLTQIWIKDESFSHESAS